MEFRSHPPFFLTLRERYEWCNWNDVHMKYNQLRKKSLVWKKQHLVEGIWHNGKQNYTRHGLMGRDGLLTVIESVLP